MLVKSQALCCVVYVVVAVVGDFVLVVGFYFWDHRHVLSVGFVVDHRKLRLKLMEIRINEMK